VVGELGRARSTDNSHARDKLGWVPRPVEETVLDTARDMIRLGIVKV
jgi:dihydroflavonol-4-reductase